MYEIKKDLVYAIIPARSGSKGVPNKNIYDIKGYPLMAYSIATAKLCGFINRVIVSTDSEEYATIARKYGAEVPFLRPGEISTSDSTDYQYLKFTLDMLGESEGIIPEYIVLLRPTTPIRSMKYLMRSFEIMKSDKSISSVVSVTKAMDCPYKWAQINETGKLEALFENMDIDDVNLPRQSFPPVYIPDGYVDLINVRTILREELVYGGNAVPLIIEEKSIDIDTLDDIERVKQSNILYDSEQYKYLNK